MNFINQRVNNIIALLTIPGGVICNIESFTKNFNAVGAILLTIIGLASGSLAFINQIMIFKNKRAEKKAQNK